MIESHSYQDWLEKAKNELRAAQAILGFYEDPPTDTVCYHCHQVAEKSLKAYTNFKIEKHIWIHDLILLLNECIKYDHDFEALRDRLENLNKYYIETKYPADIPLFFSIDEARKASADAEQVLNFVQGKVEKPLRKDESNNTSNSEVEQ